MKRFKKVFIAGLASLTLAVSTVGMTADAAGCGHIMTAEEQEHRTATGTHQVGEIGYQKTCTITFDEVWYKAVCCACGKVMNEIMYSRTPVSHSINH